MMLELIVGIVAFAAGVVLGFVLSPTGARSMRVVVNRPRYRVQVMHHGALEIREVVGGDAAELVYLGHARGQCGFRERFGPFELQVDERPEPRP